MYPITYLLIQQSKQLIAYLLLLKILKSSVSKSIGVYNNLTSIFSNYSTSSRLFDKSLSFENYPYFNWAFI